MQYMMTMCMTGQTSQRQGSPQTPVHWLSVHWLSVHWLREEIPQLQHGDPGRSSSSASLGREEQSASGGSEVYHLEYADGSGCEGV